MQASQSVRQSVPFWTRLLLYSASEILFFGLEDISGCNNQLDLGSIRSILFPFFPLQFCLAFCSCTLNDIVCSSTFFLSYLWNERRIIVTSICSSIFLSVCPSVCLSLICSCTGTSSSEGTHVFYTSE